MQQHKCPLKKEACAEALDDLLTLIATAEEQGLVGASTVAANSQHGKGEGGIRTRKGESITSNEVQ